MFVLAVIGREIDEPFAADEMKFGGPDRIAVRTEGGRRPNADSLIFADGGNARGFANENPLMVSALAIIVKALVENHPRVRRLWWQYRVNIAFNRYVFATHQKRGRSTGPQPLKDIFWMR